MLFGSLLLAGIVGNLLLFVPPIKNVSECAKTQETIQIRCHWNVEQLVNFNANRSSSIESEDEADNYAPFDVPKCFEKRQEKKNKFSSNNNLRSTPNPSKIFGYTYNHCTVKCQNDEVSRNIRWRSQQTAVEYKGPGFCLISEEFDHENCFSLAGNASMKTAMRFNLALSMSGLPDNLTKQFQGAITSIDRDRYLTDNLVRDKTIFKYQRINCIGATSDDCKIVCPIEKNTVLPNMQQKKMVDAKSHFITFWTYLFLRVFMVIIIATEMSLLKAAILTMVNGNGSEYGFQRVWASYAVCKYLSEEE